MLQNKRLVWLFLLRFFLGFLGFAVVRVVFLLRFLLVCILFGLVLIFSLLFGAFFGFLFGFLVRNVVIQAVKQLVIGHTVNVKLFYFIFHGLYPFCRYGRRR